jgi:thiamine pyrophosphate-dependent acetolactate synthase large subunit-like protein
MEVNVMSKANELYKAMVDYCEKVGDWFLCFTASKWNDVLETNYASATFTALANSGRIEKDKGYGERVYTYQLVPVGKIKEVMEKENAKREREWAESVIAAYDENIADIEAEFEEEMKKLEMRKKERIKWANAVLESAKKTIEG